MCDKSQLGELLSRVRRFALDTFGEKLHAVILYGSYARGDYDEESDIDLMILADLPADRLRGYEMAFARFGTALDLEYGVFLSFNLQDLETFERWKEDLPFYRSVIAEGVPVVA